MPSNLRWSGRASASIEGRAGSMVGIKCHSWTWFIVRPRSEGMLIIDPVPTAVFPAPAAQLGR